MPSPTKLKPPPLRKRPRHIAVIMDGNGRWAKKRGKTRISGHEEGVNSVREITEECARLKIKQLTLYAFSAENWKRPRPEVHFLMNLLAHFIVHERPTIMKNNVQFITIGRTDKLPKRAQNEMHATMELSRKNNGMVLCLALNYGGRNEIVDAVRCISQKVLEGKLSSSRITERTIAKHLYQPDMPDPDLVIRTAGEMRLSNFLLWESSYSELYVTETFWPDFRIPQLYKALDTYAKRDRRFGGLAK